MVDVSIAEESSQLPTLTNSNTAYLVVETINSFLVLDQYDKNTYMTETAPKVAAPVAGPAPAPQPIVVQITTPQQMPPAQSTPQEEPQKEVDVETLIPKDSYQTDPLFYAIADYFNVPSEEYHMAKDYISEITDYVIREQKSNDPAVLLKAIREIENKVQPPQWGEKRYWNIRKYVRLAARKGQIEKAMGAFSKE